MDNSIETQILEAEERLRLAMLHSDVSVLDELLAPELISLLDVETVSVSRAVRLVRNVPGR